jgi:hypothetical protein
VDGGAFLSSTALECGLFWREFKPFHMRLERTLSSGRWQTGFGGGALLRSEESFARGRKWQAIEGLLAEGEEDVTQERDELKAAVCNFCRATKRKKCLFLNSSYVTQVLGLFVTQMLSALRAKCTGTCVTLWT